MTEIEAWENLMSAVIEQAVVDWETLDRGRLRYAENLCQRIYRDEVLEFFQSTWFGSLYEYLTQQHDVRDALISLNILDGGDDW